MNQNSLAFQLLEIVMRKGHGGLTSRFSFTPSFLDGVIKIQKSADHRGRQHTKDRSSDYPIGYIHISYQLLSYPL